MRKILIYVSILLMFFSVRTYADELARTNCLFDAVEVSYSESFYPSSIPTETVVHDDGKIEYIRTYSVSALSNYDGDLRYRTFDGEWLYYGTIDKADEELTGNSCKNSTPDEQNIQLPSPQMDGGQPLMKALKARKTTRAFSTKTIPQQVLSNLLWAADGINRPESGGRTAPSSWDWHNIGIYVATSDGLYLYERKGNTLMLILQEDIRAKTGSLPAVNAPIVLIYVADYANNNIINFETFETFPAPYTQRVIESTANVGFISQNVYLFCASEGLVTGVRATIDKPPLAKSMRIKSSQDVIFAQSVGYPE